MIACVQRPAVGLAKLPKGREHSLFADGIEEVIALFVDQVDGALYFGVMLDQRLKNRHSGFGVVPEVLADGVPVGAGIELHVVTSRVEDHTDAMAVSENFVFNAAGEALANGLTALCFCGRSLVE